MALLAQGVTADLAAIMPAPRTDRRTSGSLAGSSSQSPRRCLRRRWCSPAAPTRTSLRRSCHLVQDTAYQVSNTKVRVSGRAGTASSTLHVADSKRSSYDRALRAKGAMRLHTSGGQSVQKGSHGLQYPLWSCHRCLAWVGPLRAAHSAGQRTRHHDTRGRAPALPFWR